MSEQCTLGNAEVVFDGTMLTARTGAVTRIWRWTGHGFLTTEITIKGGNTWRLDGDDPRNADWLLPVCEENNPPGAIRSITTELSDDEGFTSQHVMFSAEIDYAEAALAVRFTVWAYPKAPGLRVGLWIKALDGYAWNGDLHKYEISDKARRIARLERGFQRQDALPLDLSGTVRRMFGYHSDTQNRNDPYLDLLLEASDDKELTQPAPCTWANAGCVEKDGWGVALLKESHKTVNKRGHDGGIFVCLPGRGLESHGWGILPQEIDKQWRPAWATWCIVYRAGERSRQTAFKRFDRFRYPLKQRDKHVRANTWGSSEGWLEHREAASEKSVLKEIESCADLGIEVVAIDDGWQGNDYEQWRPDPERYPEGWRNVREKAAACGLQLGLWMAAAPVTLDDMQRNTEQGGFVSYKLDFANLNRRKTIDDLMTKVRRFVKSQDHAVQISWDLTEVTPRYGYFFAREYGSVYLENRKPVLPPPVTYRPATVLRDLWQVAHYCNLLKFEGSVQNIDMCNPQYTDAAAYSQDYCLAITLMSHPLFFCQTQFFSDQQRDEIRPLLSAYKKVREDIFRGIIHPLGDKPDGTRWTGFECVLPAVHRGFFMIFRELWNGAEEYEFILPHLSGKQLLLKNLLTGESNTGTVSDNGELKMCQKTASYQFIEWTTKQR